jgi:hypothetical protein
MIFSFTNFHFSECRRKEWNSETGVNEWEMLKYLLDNTKHLFISVLTTDQLEQFKGIYEKYEFWDYKVWDSGKEHLTNLNYPDKGRRLYMFALQGKGESSAY